MICRKEEPHTVIASYGTLSMESTISERRIFLTQNTCH